MCVRFRGAKLIGCRAFVAASTGGPGGRQDHQGALAAGLQVNTDGVIFGVSRDFVVIVIPKAYV